LAGQLTGAHAAIWISFPYVGCCWRWLVQVRPCNHCLVFDIEEDVAVGRLLERGKNSGRVDDNEETIRKRFQVFRCGAGGGTRPLSGAGSTVAV
jgi:adenylate kinase family enzyme